MPESPIVEYDSCLVICGVCGSCCWRSTLMTGNIRLTLTSMASGGGNELIVVAFGVSILWRLLSGYHFYKIQFYVPTL